MNMRTFYLIPMVFGPAKAASAVRRVRRMDSLNAYAGPAVLDHFREILLVQINLRGILD